MDNINKIKDFFDSLASTWDDKNADAQGAKKIVKQFKSQIKDKDILDVGCGTGVLYEPLNEAGLKSYTGIDVSEEMIKIAKENHKSENFICDDLLQWETDRKFDTIIMYNVYPHLTDKQKLVDKVYSLLKTSGVFIVAHGSSKEAINSHHTSHAMEVSRKLMKAEAEAEIWRNNFNIYIIRDNELYYFSGEKI